MSLYFADDILILLRKPINNILGNSAKFIVLIPQEYFFTQIKISIVTGIIISIPWVLFQIWLFISPGLYKQEQYYSIIFIVFGTILFISGILFSYLIIFPIMFNFFIHTLPSTIHPTYSINMLFNFEIKMLLIFGCIFEVPILIMILIQLKIINILTLQKNRKFMIVLSFIIGAILTPPDPMTQILLAIPLIILYEISIIISKILLFKSIYHINTKK